MLTKNLPEGMPPLIIETEKTVIFAAKPLTEDLGEVVLRSKMGTVRPPEAKYLGIPVGTSVGIQVGKFTLKKTITFNSLVV